MRNGRVLVGALMLGATMLGGTSLGATALGATAHTPSGGTVHLIAYGDGAGAGEIDVLTGAIGDSGFGISVDANGTTDPAKGTEQNFSLVHGSFRVSTQAIDQKINTAFNNFKPDPTTCSGMISVSGTAPIVSGSGTGAYVGISGTFTVTVTYAAIGPKLTSGKNKGQCDNSNNAPSLGSAEIVTASGTVSF